MEEIKKRKLICFDSDHAVKFGINPAILINYFQYYISKNIEGDLSGNRKPQDRSFREGRTYSYVSKENLAEFFPFFTESKVKTALNKLVKRGVIITGCFNKKKYDRTLWYAFKNEEEFLVLPTQYKEFIQAQTAKSQLLSGLNTEAGELTNSSVKTDQWKNHEPPKIPMESTLLTDSMDNSPQSIRQKSPTIPNNTTIMQNKEYTYLPNDNNYDMLNSSIQPLPEDVEEGHLSTELLAWIDKANNSKTGKVSIKSFPAASGSSHNVDAFCSLEDEVKLRKIFIQFMHETGQELTCFEKWYDWVKGKQVKPNEIKHGSAWTKSYLKFVEKNAELAKANEHEENRIKQEKLARQRLNANPYNNMRK